MHCNLCCGDCGGGGDGGTLCDGGGGGLFPKAVAHILNACL